MQIFSEFSPETVQHEFGGGFTSGVFGDAGWIEADVFLLFVVSDVFCFLFRRGHVAGVTCRFLLDLEPGVYVLRKESRFFVAWVESYRLRGCV